MTSIEKIKTRMDSYRGQELFFRFHGSRNQTEEFFGTITNTYDSVFIISLKESQFIKSFSYSDVLMRKLTISSKCSSDISQK